MEQLARMGLPSEPVSFGGASEDLVDLSASPSTEVWPEGIGDGLDIGPARQLPSPDRSVFGVAIEMWPGDRSTTHDRCESADDILVSGSHLHFRDGHAILAYPNRETSLAFIESGGPRELQGAVLFHEAIVL